MSTLLKIAKCPLPRIFEVEDALMCPYEIAVAVTPMCQLGFTDDGFTLLYNAKVSFANKNERIQVAVLPLRVLYHKHRLLS